MKAKSITEHETGAKQVTPDNKALRWASACLAFSMLLSALSTSIANVSLPTLALAFHASFQAVQWVLLAYLLAITALIVSVGRLGDIYGRRRLLLIGILLFTLASCLCAVAPSLWVLIGARTLQGLGAAIMMSLSMAMAATAVTKEKTGSAMGLLGSMSAVGTALGPTLGGMLIGSYGWPAIFLINLPLGLLTWALAYRYLPADLRPDAASQPKVSFDHLGSWLLISTLCAYALAMTLGHGSFGWRNGALLLVAVLSLILFIRTEQRATSPLLALAMLRNSVLSAGLCMSALVTSVVMATLVVGPFYLSGALRLTTTQVGLAMSCGPIVAALTGLPAGRIVDRYGSQRTGNVGLLSMLLTCSILPLLPILPGNLGVAAYVAPLMLITAGYALFQAANNTAVMTQLHSDQRGVSAGMLNLSRNLGLISGASLMGMVFALAAASPDMLTARPAALLAGMRMTFSVAAGLIVLALIIAALSHTATHNTHVAAPLS